MRLKKTLTFLYVYATYLLWHCFFLHWIWINLLPCWQWVGHICMAHFSVFFFCLFVCFLTTFDCRLHNCSTWVELLCSMWNLPSESESVTQSCPTVCDSMAWILQARILEWVAIPFSRGSTWPRNQTGVSCIAGRFFTNWVIREASILPDHGSNWRPL